MYSINAKPMGAISYQCLSTDTSPQLLMPQLGHDLQLICLEKGHDYSLAVIKAKFLYQLSIFLQVRLFSTVR